MNADTTYVDDHLKIFGHAPITDLQSGKKCIHPIHDALTAMMSAPGVDLEIEFVPQEVIGDDDPIILADRTDYDAKVQEYRDGIKKIEEEDKRKERGKTQF